MSNSALVQHTHLSPNHSGKRTQPITKITPHHMSGNLSIETCGNVFAPASRKASSNYGIGSDGRVGLYVDEVNRPWTSSSAYNDQRAVTIEVANSQCGGNWPISEKAWSTLVDLCVDIVKRNPGIKRADGRPGLNYTGDRNGSLTKHKMFSNTDCPGTYLDQRLKDLANAVNAKLDGQSYVVSADTTANNQASNKQPTQQNATISDVQSWANANYGGILGFKLAVDGIYGPKTKAALVKILQHELNKQFGAGLKVDGDFGEKTKAAVVNIKYGNSGNITKTMQALLICHGFPLGTLDGKFGDKTKSALGSFQESRGLTKDYIAGENTFSRLCA